MYPIAFNPILVSLCYIYAEKIINKNQTQKKESPPNLEEMEAESEASNPTSWG